MPAEIAPTHTPELFRAAAHRAAELLRAGHAVALPTETVYGLAANALNPGAVARIFEIKGRPESNPLIVHVASLAMARTCASEWPDLATHLSRAFWPGPLTLVLPRARIIPEIVTAGGSTVGIRWPFHPFIQEVIRLCGFPLAAPSANLSNQLSPTHAEHVALQLGDRIPLIVDGGPSNVGIESTVLDLTRRSPLILRPGIIHIEALQAACPLAAIESVPDPDTPLTVAPNPTPARSPGQLPRHYAPRAPLHVLHWHDDPSLHRALEQIGAPLEQIHILAHTHIPSAPIAARVCVIPHDPEAYARALYAELHRCDQEHAAAIVVEAPPPEPAWAGIQDRLTRASRSHH